MIERKTSDSGLEDKDKEQEQIIYNDLLEHHEKTSKKLEKENKKLTENISAYKHGINELQQEKNILEDEAKILYDITHDSEEKIKELQQRLEKNNTVSKESEQEKILIKEFANYEHKIMHNKNRKYLLGLVLTVTVLAMIVPYSLHVTTVTGQQYSILMDAPMKSNYVIQNLRGDTIDTWLSWRLIEDSVLYVNVLDGQKYADKIDIIKNVVTSEEVIEIDDSLMHKGPKGTTSMYHIGWAGALSKASQTPTALYIPNKLEIIESPKGEGHIAISLTDLRNGDGYSGFTKSIADESQNQILKSEITIYEVDKLSNAQFETILRHELGHALGLAHSSAPEDLMHSTIKTEFPYISDCNIDAIISLYDGGKKSSVVCEK